MSILADELMAVRDSLDPSNPYRLVIDEAVIRLNRQQDRIDEIEVRIAELEGREVTDEQIDRVWQLYIGMLAPYMNEDDKRRERAKMRAALQEGEKG